jgi:hypothetical protein
LRDTYVGTGSIDLGTIDLGEDVRRERLAQGS